MLDLGDGKFICPGWDLYFDGVRAYMERDYGGGYSIRLEWNMEADVPYICISIRHVDTPDDACEYWDVWYHADDIQHRLVKCIEAIARKTQ
jgi:hypothetical protein